MRVCFDDIPSVLSSVLCLAQPGSRGLWRQKEVSIGHLFSFAGAEIGRFFTESETLVVSAFHNAKP